MVRPIPGWLHFQAPEMTLSYEKGITNQTVDVWSTCVITYILLSATVPFSGVTDEDTM